MRRNNRVWGYTQNFKGNWIDHLRNMTISEADTVETSAIYRPDSSLSSVASALTHFYAVMLGEDLKAPTGIVTRWDYLELLKERPFNNSTVASSNYGDSCFKITRPWR